MISLPINNPIATLSFHPLTTSKMTMTYLTLLTLLPLLLCLPLTTCIPLESLLQSHIVSAQCSAQCLSSPGYPVDQCHQSCVSKLPTTLSPSQTQYTTGKDRNLLTTNLGSCLLTWSMELSSEPVVFLLAATDRGGMWHIVVNSLTNTTYPLLLLSRYTTVSILAISSEGLVDHDTVQLDITTSHRNCAMGDSPKNVESVKNIPRNDKTMEDISKNDTTIVYIPTKGDALE